MNFNYENSKEHNNLEDLNNKDFLEDEQTSVIFNPINLQDFMATCPEHPQNTENFCIPCKISICSICNFDSHKYHYLIKKSEFNLEKKTVENIFISIEQEILSYELFTNSDKLKDNLKSILGSQIDHLHRRLEEFKDGMYKQINSLFGKTSNLSLVLLLKIIYDIKYTLINFYNKQKKFFNFSESLNEEDNKKFLLLFEMIDLCYEKNQELRDILNRTKFNYQNYEEELNKKFDAFRKLFDDFAINELEKNETNTESTLKEIELNYEKINLDFYKVLKEKLEKQDKDIDSIKTIKTKSINRAGSLKEIERLVNNYNKKNEENGKKWKNIKVEKIKNSSESDKSNLKNKTQGQFQFQGQGQINIYNNETTKNISVDNHKPKHNTSISMSMIMNNESANESIDQSVLIKTKQNHQKIIQKEKEKKSHIRHNSDMTLFNIKKTLHTRSNTLEKNKIKIKDTIKIKDAQIKKNVNKNISINKNKTTDDKLHTYKKKSHLLTSTARNKSEVLIPEFDIRKSLQHIGSNSDSKNQNKLNSNCSSFTITNDKKSLTINNTERQMQIEPETKIMKKYDNRSSNNINTFENRLTGHKNESATVGEKLSRNRVNSTATISAGAKLIDNPNKVKTTKMKNRYKLKPETYKKTDNKLKINKNHSVTLKEDSDRHRCFIIDIENSTNGRQLKAEKDIPNNYLFKTESDLEDVNLPFKATHTQCGYFNGTKKYKNKFLVQTETENINFIHTSPNINTDMCNSEVKLSKNILIRTDFDSDYEIFNTIANTNISNNFITSNANKFLISNKNNNRYDIININLNGDKKILKTESACNHKDLICTHTENNFHTIRKKFSDSSSVSAKNNNGEKHTHKRVHSNNTFTEILDNTSNNGHNIVINNYNKDINKNKTKIKKKTNCNKSVKNSEVNNSKENVNVNVNQTLKTESITNKQRNLNIATNIQTDNNNNKFNTIRKKFSDFVNSSTQNNKDAEESKHRRVHSIDTYTYNNYFNSSNLNPTYKNIINLESQNINIPVDLHINILKTETESNILTTNEDNNFTNDTILALNDKLLTSANIIENHNSNEEIGFENPILKRYFSYATFETVRRHFNVKACAEGASPASLLHKPEIDPEEDADACKPIIGTNEIHVYDRKKRILLRKKVHLDKSTTGYSLFLDGLRHILVNDKLFITGGRDVTNEYNVVLTYDIKNDNLARIADMQNSHSYHTLEYNELFNTLLVIGGENNPTCELLEINLNHWTLLPELNIPRANVTIYFDNYEKRIFALFGSKGGIIEEFNYSDAIEILQLKEIHKGWVRLDYHNKSEMDFRQGYCNIYPLTKDKLLIYGASILRNTIKSFAVFDLIKNEIIQVDKGLMEMIIIKARRSSRLSKIISVIPKLK